AIVGPGHLAAAELSSTLHPGTYSGECGASRTTAEQPPRKDPQMEYFKIVPQSERK
nr:hypothetical protein [Tanacetum cinerariifolium]